MSRGRITRSVRFEKVSLWSRSVAASPSAGADSTSIYYNFLTLWAFPMRAVLQRVSRARVIIDQEVVGEIGRGLALLLGVARSDGVEQARWLADKIVGLRIFPDDEGKMNRSLAEVGGAALVVSQFTLYGDCQKGRRPSFVDAAPPESAVPLYEEFLTAVRALGIPVATGRFGALMQVELTNEGPVTLILDSK